MFLVGVGFRADHFKANARSAVTVSLSGMVAPFLVAVALTPWLMSLNLFGKGVNPFQAMLFMGAAISITAFPVLARIIQERGLTKTPLGSLALSVEAPSTTPAPGRCWPSCWPASAAVPPWR